MSEAEKFEGFCVKIICLCSMGFLGFLTLVSLLHTTGIEIVNAGEAVNTIVYTIREQLESVIYYNDNLFVNLLLLALCFGICCLVMVKAKKIPFIAIISTVFLWTIIAGTVWVLSSQVAPSEDSRLVTKASEYVAVNNYSIFEDRYYSNYSFQLGYVFFNEILIRIRNIFVKVDNVLFLEVLNVVFLAATYVMLLLINKELFKDERVCILTAFLFIFSAQPVIFTVFTYGIIPGLMFAVIALYFEIIYLKRNKWWCMIPSAICIMLAVMIKSNYLIMLVAMVILLVGKIFVRKQYLKDGIFILVAVSLCVAISPCVKAMYEKRSGMRFGDAVPMTSWFAMGLNESNLAPGWYNYKYTVRNLENNNYVAADAKKQSAKEIRDRIEYFEKNPQYANDFFYLKAVSQWNETSYESIWNNKVRRQYNDKNAYAAWVCGDGERAVKKYMDVYAQLIFAGCFAYVIFSFKKRDITLVAFPLVVFGGFLYHMLAEGKSQYILPYFVLMTGFAAAGICKIYDKYIKKSEGNNR